MESHFSRVSRDDFLLMQKYLDRDRFITTGDLVKVQYFSFHAEKETATIYGVFQGYEPAKRIRVFGAGDAEGLEIHMGDILSVKKLVFIPNDYASV